MLYIAVIQYLNIIQCNHLQKKIPDEQSMKKTHPNARTHTHRERETVLRLLTSILCLGGGLSNLRCTISYDRSQIDCTIEED